MAGVPIRTASVAAWVAEVNDSVYVPGRGWMAVGDLRPAMVPGWSDLQPPRRVAFP